MEIGSASPNALYKSADGCAIGNWVVNQRKIKDRLSLHQIKLLESLPRWSWDPMVDRWNKGFAYLKTFVEVTGSASPTYTDKSSDGFFFYNWVVRQRSNKDKLTKEQKQLLESLPGWVWSASTKKK